MIEVYKILTGIYDLSISPKLPLSSESVTRGNSFKIINRRRHYDLLILGSILFVIELQIYGIACLM